MHACFRSFIGSEPTRGHAIDMSSIFGRLAWLVRLWAGETSELRVEAVKAPTFLLGSCEIPTSPDVTPIAGRVVMPSSHGASCDPGIWVDIPRSGRDDIWMARGPRPSGPPPPRPTWDSGRLLRPWRDPRLWIRPTCILNAESSERLT